MLRRSPIRSGLGTALNCLSGDLKIARALEPVLDPGTFSIFLLLLLVFSAVLAAACAFVLAPSGVPKKQPQARIDLRPIESARTSAGAMGEKVFETQANHITRVQPLFAAGA
mmetsp:Transcript_4262/g.10139  ORF Transcript_4262/g.10139 Transcript_4262/m.10139 type:complete len:112 (+) Transcript_4262:856-1191(+)